MNKLVLLSGVYEKGGARKELLAMMPTLTVDMMKQSPWYAAYKKWRRSTRSTSSWKR